MLVETIAPAAFAAEIRDTLRLCSRAVRTRATMPCSGRCVGVTEILHQVGGALNDDS